MMESVNTVLIIAAALHAVCAGTENAADSGIDQRFYYDYYTLKVGGLIIAAVLCVLGIGILISGKCRCRFNQNKRRRPKETSQAHQILPNPVDSSNC
ncbi:FXYD domain-containing ion transport regulator 3-like isoform X2 [Protopterus annectens]|uniref:FXYD domain-containing ion transport regulator 3-like isoform X2 n=1 Tax=Protopterus annectens TaxID=7888 RepID=UPI001CFC19C1|nr:FXYD domain-containing ion transport regulator 3-like isoform X2 [Protopterus annectens]